VSEDVDLMVRDFRTDPAETLRRAKLRYLNNAPTADELPVRVVHPIARLRQLSTQSRDAVDAWARHAAAANGFGEGGVESEGDRSGNGAIVEGSKQPSVRKHLSPVGRRLRAMAETIAALAWVAYWLIGRFIHSWERTPKPAPTYRAIAPKPRAITTLRQSRVS